MTSEARWQLRPWPATGKSGRASFWVEQALAAEPDAWRHARRMEGTRRFDVAILGGGFTGLWTAIRLRELDPSLQIAVIEADLCGTGASGRNGGMISDWWVKVPTLLKRFGRDEAAHIVRIIAGGADELVRFCQDEAIDAQITRAGWCWTATNEAQRRVIDGVLATADALGDSPFIELDRDELERRLGSQMHLRGVRDPNGGALQPALLARGLRQVAIARGAEVLERLPVRDIHADSQGIRLRCELGDVRAQRVVLAANAWQAHLPGMREDVVVVSSDIVATASIGDRMRALGWTGGEGAFDARTMINYWRTTADGRVVFGRGGGTLAFAARIGDSFERSEKQRRAVEAELHRVLPMTQRVATTHAWSGPVERSADGLIRFGHLGGDPRLLYVIGYSGSGVVPSVTVGRCLASQLLDRDDQWNRLSQLFWTGGKHFPPEPVRYLGGRMVQAAVGRTERAEDAGRRAPWLAVSLARLAPGGVVATSRR